ncbi:MAG: RDD family protein [Acidimicrobiia bacterium]
MHTDQRLDERPSTPVSPGKEFPPPERLATDPDLRLHPPPPHDKTFFDDRPSALSLDKEFPPPETDQTEARWLSLGSFSNRAAAWISNLFLVLLLGLMVNVVTYSWLDGDGRIAANAVVGTAFVLLNWGYLEGVTGSSFGKREQDLRVVGHRTGEPIGFNRSVARYLFAGLWTLPLLLLVGGSWVASLCTAPLLLGYVWAKWDDENRAWHDMVVGSRVVNWRYHPDL